VSDPAGDAVDGVAEALDQATDQPTLLRLLGLGCGRGRRGRGRAGSEDECEQHEGSGDPDTEDGVPDDRAPGCAQRLVHALTS
jgi:hypothetical protein